MAAVASGRSGRGVLAALFEVGEANATEGGDHSTEPTHSSLELTPEVRLDERSAQQLRVTVIRSKNVTAYMVALVEPAPDKPHWSTTEYGPTFLRLLEKYGGSTIAAAPLEQVEGLPRDESSAAVFQFPTTSAAHAFWNDPEYRAVVPLRLPLGTFQIFILPGMDEEPWTPPASN